MIDVNLHSIADWRQRPRKYDETTYLVERNNVTASYVNEKAEMWSKKYGIQAFYHNNSIGLEWRDGGHYRMSVETEVRFAPIVGAEIAQVEVSIRPAEDPMELV